MNDHAALRADVLNDPADDTARLALADWLEEHGEEDFWPFIRYGVTAARFRGEAFIEDAEYCAALAGITAVVNTGNPARWVASLGIGPERLAARDWAWDSEADRVPIRIGRPAGVFARGLIAELELPLAGWYAPAAPALAAWPIERARVVDAPA